MSWFAIQDGAAGRKSRSAFIALAAFWFAGFKFLFSGATIKLYEHVSVNFGNVDAALMGAFLGSCLALYGGRRFTDAKFIPMDPEPKRAVKAE
ncbi:MAG: hypothetical protein WC356_01690 [Candidatus Micrarchaeia archaeon]